jgi:hypothetical protein
MNCRGVARYAFITLIDKKYIKESKKLKKVNKKHKICYKTTKHKLKTLLLQPLYY